jgi:hypothetical protein
MKSGGQNSPPTNQSGGSAASRWAALEAALGQALHSVTGEGGQKSTMPVHVFFPYRGSRTSSRSIRDKAGDHRRAMVDSGREGFWVVGKQVVTRLEAAGKSEPEALAEFVGREKNRLSPQAHKNEN